MFPGPPISAAAPAVRDAGTSVENTVANFPAALLRKKGRGHPINKGADQQADLVAGALGALAPMTGTAIRQEAPDSADNHNSPGNRAFFWRFD